MRPRTMVERSKRSVTADEDAVVQGGEEAQEGGEAWGEGPEGEEGAVAGWRVVCSSLKPRERLDYDLNGRDEMKLTVGIS